MAQLKLIDTIQSKLEEVSKSDGQLILEKDGKNLYFDFNGDRIQISDFIELDDEDELTFVLAPLPSKFYFIKNNASLWRYLNNEWVCIAKSSNILMSREFDNVLKEDNIMYYASIKPIDFNSSWTLKFRIYADVAGAAGATQYADIFLSGIGDSLGTYEAKNTIYDLGLRCIANNILYLLNQDGFNNGGKHYLGIDLSNTKEEYSRTISIEIYEATNCLFEWAGTSLVTATNLGISALDYSKTIYIEFSQNGEFTNTTIKKEDLSNVAFSGSYNDLLDKPSLLDVAIDENTDGLLNFFKN
jgi:hypothetical protein